jgi:hypothetical protein
VPDPTATLELNHFKKQTQLAIQGGHRLRDMLQLATAFEWATADGRAVRVEPLGDVWAAYVDGKPVCTKAHPDAAIDAAARIAPPADAELARTLTWTACGRPRA